MLAAAALVVLVVVTFGRTGAYVFIDFDDPYYVTSNAIVQNGITGDGAVWALTTSDYFYWHPLTWLSHMLDCQLYGLQPRGHHLTNVAIHAATTVLVLAAFFSTTGAFWRSAAVAALFAVHPLHVEPIAWISERKELLAGFFWFASIAAYASYTRRPSVPRYLLIAVCFVAGLMSKPVVVTLPVVLLLLDIWPLRRPAALQPGNIVREKGPLFLLSAASSMLTYYGQAHAGAMRSLGGVPFVDRVRHAVMSCAVYLGNAFWPHPLAPMYPYGRTIDAAAFAGAVLLLGAITIGAIRMRDRAPFLAAGWFWFLVVLSPMIGLIQVGGQSHADRFMYLPIVGLFVVAVWGAGTWLEGRAWGRRTAIVLAAAVIPALALTASAQTRYWSDSVTLWRHTIAVTPDNATALHLLGFGLATEGRLAEAVPYYQESLRLTPNNPLGHYNLALALEALQRPVEAAASFANAARLHPPYAEAHYGLGATLLQLNKLPEAREELEAALRLPLSDEYSAQAHFRLGLIGAYQGDMVRARDGFAAALRVQPDFPEARANLDRALAQLKTAK